MANIRVRPNIPIKLHNDDRETVGFLQAILDYVDGLVQVGSSIKWGSTIVPSTHYLFKSGQTVNKADYPLLWTYAQNDASYTTTSTTITIPNDAGYVVKARI